MNDNNIHDSNLLFRRLSQGDADAFKQLFQHFYEIIYLTALTYGKNAQLAEDVTQQIFLKMWERRSELSHIDNPQGWLYQAAKFQIADALKKEWSKQRYLESIAGQLEFNTDDPEAKAIEKQEYQMLEDAIAALPSRQREVFKMSRVKGMTYDAIATELGIGRETVKEHLSRALKALRASLKHIMLFFWFVVLK